jgi:hypothetical protein
MRNSAHRARKNRWCCSPSSSAAFLDQAAVVDEGVRRHELDGGHAEALEESMTGAVAGP